MLNVIPFSPSNFGRYVSQTEQPMEEPIDTNEWTSGSLSTKTDIPSLMSIPTTPLANVTASMPQRTTTLLSSLVTDDVEPLPFPHHSPGPIQRPNKLSCSSTQASSTLNVNNTIQPPGTPDLLDQINHLIYDHSTSTTTPSTASVNQMPMNSPLINDLASPNIPWTPFAQPEWPPKPESSWPLTTLQSPNVSMTSSMQNPFVMMAAMTEQPRQMSRGEPPSWSPAIGATQSRFVSPSIRTQRANMWNDIFSSTVPSSNESSKPVTNSWLKFWPAPDPSTADGTSLNGHDTVTENQFWNLSALSNDSVVPSSSQSTNQLGSSTWWSTSSSDENNNTNSLNPSNDEPTTNRDQSRWDFAR